ncbi:MAG: heparan-alpha-glucosaminide N-acetyltransferase [Burkholderiaceae bacterium]
MDDRPPPPPEPPAAAAREGVASAGRPRFDRLDAWRGAAIVWMAGFHFSFDLNMVGLRQPAQDFYADPFWTTQRLCIVSMFLLGAGAGQAVAVEAGQPWRRFWRRWAQVAGCAALVSIATMPVFPGSWISFGVLHGMAVMLVVLRLLGSRLPPVRLARAPFAFALATAAAALAWALPHVARAPAFDSRLMNWTGLVTRLPITEDYVPVLPWLGMMLAGYLIAALMLAHGRAPIAGGVPAWMRPLAALGRWPLSFYMLHQPILIGSLFLFRMAFR